MAPSDGRSLAQGAVVETRLCARLLGIKLLVIDGAVTLVPGRADGPVVVGRQAWADTDEVRAIPVLPPRGRAVNGAAAGASDAVLGTLLDESAHRLEANARRLRELRCSRTEPA
jgi:hypothetical protein